MTADTRRAILVTGAGGQLGTELQRCAWPQGYEIVAIDHDTLDLRDSAAIAAIAAMVASRPWVAVINGAAYTAVDKAETDVVTAWAVNAMAPAAFGEACAQAGIPLVQVSTDYVFAGDKQGAWEVNDPVAPLGVYGASKLGGELAVRTSGARHAIVRTAWVVSAHGHNVIKTISPPRSSASRMSAGGPPPRSCRSPAATIPRLRPVPPIHCSATARSTPPMTSPRATGRRP